MMAVFIEIEVSLAKVASVEILVSPLSPLIRVYQNFLLPLMEASPTLKLRLHQTLKFLAGF